MKISFNWIKNYCPVNISANEVAGLLTNCGLEVESVAQYESIKGGLVGIVIGEVMETMKHPNADKLTLTKINVGNAEPLNIVCGAPNVAKGQKVAVAMVGATLFPAAGEPFEIKKSKIRGEISEGMICAEDEIGMGESHDGIMVLDDSAEVGSPAADYFKAEEDIVFEIGLTPNRADAASHIGVARDLAAVLNAKSNSLTNKLLIPSVEKFKIDNHDLKIEVVIENPEACPRYSGLCLTNVKMEESPNWLQNRLRAIGLKPINNVVDITNFVLFETGQPLHAFDADKISGKKVIVKNLPAGTEFITLDELKRKLTGNDLMICDAEKGMCIAGVFGGAGSGITERTKNVFLESAHFNPVAIRKSSKHHGLKTDASFRFERGTDVDATVYALKRAALLMKEICGAKISSEIVDVYPEKIKKQVVKYFYERAYRLTGTEIKPQSAKNIFSDLGIKILSETDSSLELEIPGYKTDVTHEADAAEEVLRIYGFDKIPLLPKMNMPVPVPVDESKEKLVNAASQFLVSNGFFEIFSNSLTKEKYSEILNKKESAVKILNPLSMDLNVLRQTMIFSGLEAIQYNSNRQHPDIRFFEFGKIYSVSENGFSESEQLGIFLSGSRYRQSWVKQEPEDYSIYYLKSLLNNLFLNTGISSDQLTHHVLENNVFNQYLAVSIGKSNLASYGVLDSSLAKIFDIDSDVFYASIAVQEWLSAMKSSQRKISEPPKFPEVRRDISMLVSKDVSYSQIEMLAFETGKKILRDVNLFDVYKDEKITGDKISYALSFILRDDEKTLEEKQIERVMQQLMNAFEEKLGAQIRK